MWRDLVGARGSERGGRQQKDGRLFVKCMTGTSLSMSDGVGNPKSWNGGGFVQDALGRDEPLWWHP